MIVVIALSLSALLGYSFVSLSFYAFSLVLFSRFLGNVIQPVTRRRQPEEVMHLAVVACGKRLDETLTMLKSALLFSLKKIKFHIFAEDPLAPQFEERVRDLQRVNSSMHTMIRCKGLRFLYLWCFC